MKRKVIVSITFVVLLCSIVLCVINQKKAPFIEGVIVEKNEAIFYHRNGYTRKNSLYFAKRI